MPVPAAPTGLLQAETLNEAQLHLTAASNMALAHLDALAQAASKVKLNVGNAETGLPPKDPLRVPTNWWSAQDQAFFNTVVMTLAVVLFSMLMRHLLQRIPGMRESVFEPRIYERTEAEQRREEERGGPPRLGANGPAKPRGWFILRPWRRWWADLRRHEVALDEDMECGLEAAMLMRFMRFNLLLFSVSCIFVLPSLLPLNVMTRYDDELVAVEAMRAQAEPGGVLNWQRKLQQAMGKPPLPPSPPSPPFPPPPPLPERPPMPPPASPPPASPPPPRHELDEFGHTGDAAVAMEAIRVSRLAQSFAPPPPPRAESHRQVYSGLETLSISHVPRGSARLWGSVLLCWLVSALYLWLLRLEWDLYTRKRHRWLSRFELQHHAVLLRVLCRDPLGITPAQLLPRLRALFGAAVLECVELHELDTLHYLKAAASNPTTLHGAPKAAQDALASTTTLSVAAALRGLDADGAQADAGAVTLDVPLVGAAVGPPLPPPSTCHRLSTWFNQLCGCGPVIRETKQLLQAEAGADCRFLILFQTRQAAHLCAAGGDAWHLQLFTSALTTIARPAPAPRDAYWPNLLPPKPGRYLLSWVALVLMWGLFLFWTIPVALVQAMATVSNLAKVQGLEWLASLIQQAGSRAVHLVEGTVASLTLIFFRALTLYSGLFQLLVRLRGAPTHTEVQARSAALMMLFQLLLVVLASVIASSLFDLMWEVINRPLQLPALLADNLPGQSTFFLHYLVNQFALAALIDLLQLPAVALHVCERLFGCCCGRLLRKGLAFWQEGDYLHFYIYARLVLVSSIALVFCFVAPVAMVFALGYYAFLYPWLAGALREVYTKPLVDTGGAVWQQAVAFQTYALIVAQLLLAGVMVTKAHYPCALAALIVCGVTFVLERSMRNRLAGQAQRLPLQLCVELDAAPKGVPRVQLNLTPFLYDSQEGQYDSSHDSSQGIGDGYS